MSRKAHEQRPKVEAIAREVAARLEFDDKSPTIVLWDDYFAPRYGEPDDAGMAAIKLLAEQEAMLLDPVYIGKAMAGLLDDIELGLFPDEGPILFIHTGGAPALFAYHPFV